jgi:hypothetical protein
VRFGFCLRAQIITTIAKPELQMPEPLPLSRRAHQGVATLKEILEYTLTMVLPYYLMADGQQLLLAPYPVVPVGHSIGHNIPLHPSV